VGANRRVWFQTLMIIAAFTDGVENERGEFALSAKAQYVKRGGYKPKSWYQVRLSVRLARTDVQADAGAYSSLTSGKRGIPCVRPAPVS
jgi:hypothetical protein